MASELGSVDCCQVCDRTISRMRALTDQPFSRKFLRRGRQEVWGERGSLRCPHIIDTTHNALAEEPGPDAVGHHRAVSGFRGSAIHPRAPPARWHVEGFLERHRTGQLARIRAGTTSPCDFLFREFESRNCWAQGLP